MVREIGKQDYRGERRRMKHTKMRLGDEERGSRKMLQGR